MGNKKWNTTWPRTSEQLQQRKEAYLISKIDEFHAFIDANVLPWTAVNAEAHRKLLAITTLYDNALGSTLW